MGDSSIVDEHVFTRRADRITVHACRGKGIGLIRPLAEDGVATCPNCGWRMTAKRMGGLLQLMGLSR